MWSARKFRTTAEDLEQLWQSLPEDIQLTVVMEPTRNAWVPLAAWFRRHDAHVVLIPPEQSADLRDYYSKHTKSDRLDSRILARLPLLHPEGLRAAEGMGPADPMRRATKLRANLVKRRTMIIARLDCYLELLGPQWHRAFAGDLVNNTPLQLCKEIRELDERIAVLLQERDPGGIMASAPGLGKINAAQILARLGDPNRFQSLAGARSFSGLVPSLDASGVNGHHGSPTKSGDAPLREALFMAAGAARRVDPTLAARYHRLMVKEGKHHNSALCNLSTALLTRMISC